MRHRPRQRLVWAALALLAAPGAAQDPAGAPILKMSPPRLISTQWAPLRLSAMGPAPAQLELTHNPIVVPEPVESAVRDESNPIPTPVPSIRVHIPVVRLDEQKEQAPRLPELIDDTVIRINTAPPVAEELFRLETESQLRARLRKETERWRDRVHIPEFTLTPGQALPQGRRWPPALEHTESGRVCFLPLGFAQPRSERYGRSLGPLQPLVSLGTFYGDIVTWPLRALTPPWTLERCDDLSDLPSSVPWEVRTPAPFR